MMERSADQYSQCEKLNIPMLDLGLQYQTIKDELISAIEATLESGVYINGPPVFEFEQNIAHFLGVKNALGVASGSDALLLALHVLGIKPGDQVVVPAFTFFATAEAVSRMGAIPVFADIDPVTYNIDPKHLQEILQKARNIKAVIPVHLFGLPCAMTEIMQIADEHNLYVVEDACQAINAMLEFRGKRLKAGTIGDIGCFSFFPTKNLGCFGDGGLLVTDNDELAEKLKLLRTHGSSHKYYHRLIGYNSRLDTLQAAVLNIKLKYLEEWTRKRQHVAEFYNQQFKLAGIDEQLKLPTIDYGHVFHQYVIQSSNRDKLSIYLREKGIQTSVYYPLPLHLQEAYKELGYQAGSLPTAENACQRVLALPIDPNQTIEQSRYIVDHILNFISKN